MYDSLNNSKKIIAFPKCGLPFLWCQYYLRYEEFQSDFYFFILNDILRITGNIESTKRKTTCLIPRLGIFCDNKLHNFTLKLMLTNKLFMAYTEIKF